MKRASTAGLAVAGMLLAAGPGWASAPTCRYAVGTETVLDKETGLLWQRQVPSSTYTQYDGASYCQGLSLGGFTSGWRMPSMPELRTLVDVRAFNPAIDSTAFPATPLARCWSSTYHAMDSTNFAYIDFADGSGNKMARTTLARVRCVRWPTLAFSSESQSAMEARLPTVTLSLSAALSRDLSVPYTLSGTATEGSDYTVSPASPLVIPAGQTRVTIAVSLFYDATTEASETVVVTLGSLALGDPALLGATSVHTLTILDGCPPDNEWMESGAVLSQSRSLGFDEYTWDADTVLDSATGLRWQRAVPAGLRTYAAASTYCQNLSLGGFGSGWRLPTRSELISIVDYGRVAPSINTAAFPNLPASSWFWSSTAYAGGSAAWAVEFVQGGKVSPQPTATSALWTRCVR